MKKERYSVRVGKDIWFEASSAARLVKDLQAEKEHWESVFPRPVQDSKRAEVRVFYQSVIDQIAQLKEPGIVQLQDHSGHAIFPPRASSAGRLLGQLASSGDTIAQGALLSYLWGKNRWKGGSHQPLMFDHHDHLSPLRYGSLLLHAYELAEGLFEGKGAVQAVQAKAEHLDGLIEDQRVRTDKLDAASHRYEERASSAERQADLRVRALREFTARQIERERAGYLEAKAAWEDRWEDTLSLYRKQLGLRRPVELWNGAVTRHKDNARYAFLAFVALAVITLLCAVVLVWCFGGAVANTFSETVCDFSGHCREAFSFRGPLTVGAILIGASILIWSMRFASRIYLSERHLAITAEERSAFTESYLAMIADNALTPQQGDIVLAALFRHSQDGIVKDDDGPLDISAAAILAKAMAGPR